MARLTEMAADNKHPRARHVEIPLDNEELGMLQGIAKMRGLKFGEFVASVLRAVLDDNKGKLTALRQSR